MRNNPFFNILIYFFLPVLIFLTLTSHTEAWGPQGHRVVARLAERHLSPHARKEVARLLEGLPLDSVAIWADDIRRGRPETYRWHFVDIPNDKDDYLPSRDCKNLRTGDCIVEAVDQFKEILADTSERMPVRAEALKFLVHFLGDMHQPLHCADDNDRGGNDVQVKFFGESMNLHRVWDGGIIGRMDLSDEKLTEMLDASLSDDMIKKYQQGTTVDWALESHRIAVEYTYGKKPQDNVLGFAYYDMSVPIVEDQLKKSGARLARTLNEALQN